MSGGSAPPLLARAAASFGIVAPNVKLTGYNETIVGPGLRREVQPKAAVLTGLDVLAEDNFAALRGKRIGLITNATGRARDGSTDIALFQAAPEMTLVALFAPEHGLASSRDELIADDRDELTGLPVYSLYGKGFRPTPESLAGIDTLVFDSIDKVFITLFYNMHRVHMWFMSQR